MFILCASSLSPSGWICCYVLFAIEVEGMGLLSPFFDGAVFVFSSAFNLLVYRAAVEPCVRAHSTIW